MSSIYQKIIGNERGLKLTGFLPVSILLFAWWFGLQPVHAVTLSADTIVPLEVGDPVPDISIPEILNYETTTARLSDFAGQLLILDFFDTYCVACIEGLPKLMDFQQKMGDAVKVMIVTWQSKDEINSFFANNKFLKEKGVLLPCIVQDSVLRKYFKHRVIPHVAWIYNDSVQAITHSEYVTKENADRLLRTGSINLPLKYEIDHFDATQPLFDISFPSVYDKDKLAYSGILGYRDGVDFVGIHIARDSSRNTTRSYFYNLSLFDVCKFLLFKLDRKKFILTPKRIVLEVEDPNKYRYPEGTDMYQGWLRENAVSYERYEPLIREDKDQYHVMLADISNYFGISVSWQRRTVECLVIKRAVKSGEQAEQSTRVGLTLEGSGTLAFSLDMTQVHPPVIDECGYTGELIIDKLDDIVAVNEQLREYGLVVAKEPREIDVMVVKEI